MKRNRIGRRRPRAVVCAVAAVLAVAVPSAATHATTITLAFDTQAGNFPSSDPDGSKLQQTAFAARDYWLTLLPESGHDYAVTIHYNQLSGDTLGVYNNVDHTIQIRNNTTWYHDPDPTTHDEFGPFNQVLYRDLEPGADKSSLHGPVPDLLEVGYWGRAPAGTSAGDGNDMLWVMLHEMGHFLEIGHNIFAPPVPLQSQFLGNRTGISADRINESHLVVSTALMDPGTGAGRRVLPSALDLIVAAHEQNHGEIAMERVDWIGDALLPGVAFWNHAPGWIGAEEPSANTEVTVRAQTALTVASKPAVAHTFRLMEDSSLTLLDDLSVGLDAEVRGNSFFDHPFVNVGSNDVSVGRNLIIDLGDVNLAGGTLDVGNLLVINGQLSSDNTSNFGSLHGHGTVHVGGELRNRARIAAEGGTLTVNADPGVTFDLDGNQESTAPGRLVAVDGNLEFNAPIHDAYSGSAFIAGGHSLRFTGDWTFDGSQVFFIEPGDAVFAAKTPGADMNFVSGYLSADDTDAHLQAGTIRFAPTSGNNVEVLVLSGATLSLDGAIEYTGTNVVGSGFIDIHGSGTIRQNGDATVNGWARVQVDHYDWDGFGVPATKTTITPGSTFWLNVDDLAGAYGGQAELGEDAVLRVDINSGSQLWLLSSSGRIQLNDGSKVTGSRVTVAGKIDALSGGSDLDVPATLTATSLVTIADKATLNLLKPVVYGGGSVTTKTGQPDDSALAQHDSASAIGHHTITTGYFNWDPSNDTASDTTIESNGHLEIHAKEIGNGITNPLSLLDRRGFGNRIANNSGRLEVHVGFEEPTLSFPPQWEINKTGELFMNATDHALPTVAGSKLVNHGLISGVGTFENKLDNRGILAVGHASAAGRLQVLDVFAQDDDGLLAMELGGTDAGVSFDQLYLEDGGTLNGKLDVALLGDFLPKLGDVFRIIDAGTLSQLTGTFDQTTLPPGQWDLIYGGNHIDVRFVPEPAGSMAALAAIATALRRRRRR